MRSSVHQFNLGLPTYLDIPVKWLLGLDRCEKIYQEVKLQNPCTAHEFCKSALLELGATVQISPQKIDELRKIKGPLIFVANHPFGAIDALVLMLVMSQVRSDFKFLGNSILEAIPEISKVLFSVDIMEGKIRPSINANCLRKLLHYLKQGGTLGLFPAGEVAAFKSWSSKKAQEQKWHDHLNRIVIKSQATVVPIFFEGQNSILFQYLGLLIPKIRIALLVREMLNYKKQVKFIIGKPVSYSEFKIIPKKKAGSFFRDITLSLEN